MDFMGGGGGADGEAAAPLLARQGSVYSLTFDEFQTTLGGMGKDFGSMNMDELLKNIWTAEESYAMAAALGDGCGRGGGAGAGPGLQRQGSLTLPRTLSQKTVDEVWKDLIGGSAPASSQGIAAAAAAATVGGANVPRQPTLGEMTLEEFLVRAGVVREDLAPPLAPPRPAGDKSNSTNMFFGDVLTASNSSGLALGFNQTDRPIPNNSAANLGMAVTSATPYAAPVPLGNGVDMGNPQGMRGGGLVNFGDAGMDIGLMTGMVGLGTAGVVAAKGSPVNPLSSDSLGKGNGDLSSVWPAPYVFSGGMRARKCSGTVEKVMERRQKRMIKNRESAARSRARKQAYTMELEAEVEKLKEQNQELETKQVEMMEMQKNQALQIINEQHAPKKQCLTRTLTGPW